MERIAQLEKFLEEDPEDPFNSYALALEYLKVDASKAHELFAQLLDKHPEYLPTYYPYAHLLTEPKMVDEVFRRGIDMARQAGDTKTLKELSNAYNDWLFEQS